MYDKEKVRFWEELGQCTETFKMGMSVIVLRNMNAKLGDMRIEGVLGRFGVDENGECLTDMCAAREMMVGDTHFRQKPIRKYA